MKISILLGTFLSLTAFSQNAPIGQSANAVVIELFTSQGCSSCPAADKNLLESIEAAEKNGQAVYGLSFHVDYWNYLGWKDPYSKPEFTARQRNYSQIMNSENIYTPQMIVNGGIEFVGSNKKAMDDAIALALTKNMEYIISLNSLQRREGKIQVSYTLNSLRVNLTVNFAVVERRAENEVSKGENSGRKLTHGNVVRSFISTGAQKEGALDIEFPIELSASSLIVFVQDKQWHILGVTAKRIN